jgi:hypothetical protein
MIKTTQFERLIFPVFCLVALALLAFIIVYIETLIVQPKIAPLLDEGALNDAQKTGIDYVAGLGELMINWSVATIGAIALSAKGIQKQQGMEKLFSGFSLVFGFIASIISIWLGMLVLDITINSLTLEQDPLQNASLYLCRRWQYLSFVCALVFFVFSQIVSVFYTPSEIQTKK